MRTVPRRPPGPRSSAPSRARWSLVCAAMVTALGAHPGVGAAATSTVRAADASSAEVVEARQLLEAAATSPQQPHVGRVSIVTFSTAGPRVADLDVRVDAMGSMELRRPTRWLLGGPTTSWLRTGDGAIAVTPAATGARLEVDTVLRGWDATVEPPQELDTGPAVPVHLVRRTGAAIHEILYIDEATGIAVRRETRDADGDVLRVVAYTSLALVDVGAPASLPTAAADEPGPPDPAALTAEGYDVPTSLAAGFQLVGVAHDDDMATARYGDGLSVLSVYQQHGDLDPSELDGATVRLLAGRDVWVWPASEPLRLVWTGGDRTWTVVSDAPIAVVADAIASLPGDRIGHDVPSRIARGLARAADWARRLVGA